MPKIQKLQLPIAPATPIVTPPKMRCSSIESECPSCGAPHYVQIQGDLDLDLLQNIPEKLQLQVVARSPETGGAYAILSFATGIYSAADALKILEAAINPHPAPPVQPAALPPTPDAEVAIAQEPEPGLSEE